jgi:hypothetical protein
MESESSIVKTPVWCPKCATFHPEPQPLCKKCGAAMPNAGKGANQQSGGSAGLIAGLIVLGGMAWLLSYIFPTWMVIAFVILGILVIAGAHPDPLKAKQDEQIVCPQCQKRGSVRTKNVSMKRGISGGKATGAILTGGLSLLATGLSRKEDATEAKCSNCGSVWHF